ncbi:excinuclease ABC subunit C [archaeon]|nr:MAG: excinuclease ABC subunit C [archaeon]
MVQVEDLPIEPGCYLFKNDSGEVIYVGKAKALRARVRSYFSSTQDDPKTALLVSEIDSLDYIVTSSEVEALILESTLIKQYRPRFNIDLKESQRYAYILITEEHFPRLLVVRDKTRKGKYFGPFVNGEARDNIVHALRSAFGIRRCNRMKKRPCLRAHIRTCSAPCSSAISEEEYGRRIRQIETFLNGKVDDLITELTEEMHEHASNEAYEKALVLRDQIASLASLHERQQMERTVDHDEDIINYVREDDTVYLMVFHIKRGVMTTKDDFQFTANDEAFLDEFIVQYYADTVVPKEVVVPHAPKDDAIADYLGELHGSKVYITFAKRGRKKELLDLVKRNIETHFLLRRQMMEDLRQRLDLPTLPACIECFDVSHISGRYMVGSSVQFKHGVKEPSGYRRYRIRTVEGIDDYAALHEVVWRRYRKLRDDGSALPDLVVIDGGRGQLNAAAEALCELGVDLPLVAIAKREEELFVREREDPIVLPKHSKGLRLLIQIRDEAHRFAISYHTLLRTKGMTDE